MWDNLSNFIIKYRILSIVIICAITVFMAQHALNVEYSVERAKILPSSHQVYLDNQDFQEKFFSLVKGPETPILLYCRTGNRTEMLGNALIDQVGLKNVYHLTDGIVEWKKSGNKTSNYRQTN